MRSLHDSEIKPAEILVVDDGSTDNTAATAIRFGAFVLRSDPLPAGWTGKTWACYQGAKRAATDLLLFLDADTYFVPGGMERLMSLWGSEENPRRAISVLPYRALKCGYEQLSIFFNLLMAAGAGGFGVFRTKSLFGQSLLISKCTYWAVGGHEAVKDIVLENLRMARVLRCNGNGDFAIEDSEAWMQRRHFA